MVTITNGIKSFRVTAGAVGLYESMGCRAVPDEEVEEMSQMEHEDFEEESVPASKDDGNHNTGRVTNYAQTGEDMVKAKEDSFVEELLEKPLSQWTSEEVKDFVRIKGIDTSGVQKLSQVRAIIKTYLEEEQKKSV